MQMRPGRIATVAAQPDLLARRNNLAHPRIDVREMGEIDFVLFIIDEEAYRYTLPIEPPLACLEHFANHRCADDRPHRCHDVDALVVEVFALLAIRVFDLRGPIVARPYEAEGKCRDGRRDGHKTNRAIAIRPCLVSAKKLTP